MYESGPFWDGFGHVKWVSFRFDEVRAEVVRDMYIFEEERNV